MFEVELPKMGKSGVLTHLPRLFLSHTGPETGAAMSQMQDILKKEFGQLDFDRKVHDTWESMANPTVDLVAEQLGQAPPKIDSAVCRLQSRGFILPERTAASV